MQTVAGQLAGLGVVAQLASPHSLGDEVADEIQQFLLGPARARWKVALLIAVAVAVLVLMIVLHVTGVVGANSNGIRAWLAALTRT